MDIIQGCRMAAAWKPSSMIECLCMSSMDGTKKPQSPIPRSLAVVKSVVNAVSSSRKGCHLSRAGELEIAFDTALTTSELCRRMSVTAKHAQVYVAGGAS